MRIVLLIIVLTESIIFANEYEVGFKNPKSKYAITQDDFFDARPIDLDANIAVGSSCGEIDFVSNAKAGFENALDTIKSREFLDSAIKAAPLLAACSFDDAVCAAIQSINQTASFFASFKLKQCELIDKYIGGKANAYREQMSVCMAKSRGGGKSENEAQAECYQTLSDKLASISENTEYVKKINVLGDTYKWLGVTPSKEEINALEGRVGEESISSGRIRTFYGNESNTPTTYYKRAIDNINHMNKTFCQDQLKNRYIGMEEYYINRDQELVKRIREVYNWETLKKLSSIKKDNIEDVCERLVDTGIKKSYMLEINKRLAEISYALSENPNNTEQSKDKLKRAIELLKKDYEALNRSILLSPAEIERLVTRSYSATNVLANKQLQEDQQNKILDAEINNECVYRAECE